MATETDGSEGAPHPADPVAGRESRREPPVIDATAEEVKEEKGAEAEPVEEELAAAEEPPEPKQSVPRPPAAMTRRILPWAALVLAVIALLLVGAVGTHVFVTTDGAIVDLRAASAALQSHIAVLDQKSAAPAAAPDALAALQQRLAALEASTKAVSDKLASLQAEADKPTSAAGAPAPPAQQVDLGPLQQRISGIEAQLQPLAANVANLQTQLQPLTSNVANLQTQLQPMVANVANLQSQLQPLAATVAASKADVSANQDIVRKAVSASDAAALVVVTQSLVGAVDRGAPFTSEVAAAQALGAGADRIGTLQPLAAKGVPTAAALADSFAPLAAPILTGSQQKEPKGLLDRLERDASSLVRVRPVGAAAARGTDPASIVARIEGALAQGDTAAALSAWNQLPAAAKNVTGDWANSAKARVAADTAAHALLADAIDRLGRPKS